MHRPRGEQAWTGKERRALNKRLSSARGHVGRFAYYICVFELRAHFSRRINNLFSFAFEYERPGLSVSEVYLTSAMPTGNRHIRIAFLYGPLPLKSISGLKQNCATARGHACDFVNKYSPTKLFKSQIT